jgi:SNF2 family DNA or RNA helicase
MLAWIGQHEDEPLSAPVVIAQLIRLQQAALAMLEWHETGRMIPIRDPYIPDVTKLRPETKIRLIEPSVKLDTLFELIKDEGLCQRNHHGSVNPLVQFSQSKSFTKLVTRRMTAEGLRVAEFTGDTPDGIRGDLIKDFQNGQYDVFAATIATGGEGITLTRSSTMTFTDRTWNPSKNRQAEDREHRIGQPNAVHIIDIMARDTVDYRVRDTNIDKWASLRALLGDTSRGKRNRGS